MARALVIGGTLFIGRALVPQLLDHGDDVTIMHRSRGTPFGNTVAEIRCDRNDVHAVREALRGRPFDVIYDNVYDWERGTSGDQVRAAAEAAGPDLRRYVFTSSVAAYGAGTDHDETDTLAPPDHPDPYGRDKADSERALFRLHRERGVPVSTLRPAFIYGPGNPYEREAFFWDRILAGRPVVIPGDGSRTMQFVLVDDVASAAIRAAETDAAIGSAYNLANAPPMTQVEFVRALARAAGLDVQLVHVPRERIAAAGGGLLEPPLYFGAYLDLPSLTVRVDRARSELGLTLTPLDEGLRTTFEWYRRQQRPRPDFSWENRLLAMPD
jgi:nucleoside-diphosphate-sugar epimerase